MNTETGKPATLEDFAAQEFEPWTKDKGDWTPPTQAEWPELSDPHLVMLRVAFCLMFKTKSELIDLIQELGEDKFTGVADQIIEASNFFKGLHLVAEQANLRLLGAAATSVKLEKTAA